MKQNNLTTERSRPVSLWKPVLIGAGIALAAISFFVFGVDAPHPEWGELWQVKPLIIASLAGAAGGAFYYFLDHLRYRNGLNPVVAVVLSVIVYVIGLWLGVVLGLNGTMWD